MQDLLGERIVSAAARLRDGRILTAECHADICGVMEDSGVDWDTDMELVGFATSERPFITTQEALTLARSTGQLRSDYVRSVESTGCATSESLGLL